MKVSKEIRVWGEDWEKFWTPDRMISISREEFGEISPGNPFITRYVKSHSEIYYLRMEKRGKYSEIIGIIAPHKIIEEAIREEEKTKNQREENRLKKELRFLKRVKSRILELFASIPSVDLEEVLEKFQIGSETVGRVGSLDLDERIGKAIWAHIRHSHTEYEELYNLENMEDFETRAEIRSELKSKVNFKIKKIYNDWRKPKKEEHQDENLKERSKK